MRLIGTRDKSLVYKNINAIMLFTYIHEFTAAWLSASAVPAVHDRILVAHFHPCLLDLSFYYYFRPPP